VSILCCLILDVHTYVLVGLKGDRLDKKFTLDLKDINEHPGVDYEASIGWRYWYLCIVSLVCITSEYAASHFSIALSTTLQFTC